MQCNMQNVGKMAIKQHLKLLRDRVAFRLGHNTLRNNTSSIVVFGNNSRFRECNIIVHGKNNKVIFGNNCNMCGMRILIEGDNNAIEFGDGVKINASKSQSTVINACGGTTIKIGTGSLLSNNIEIHSSDYHGIYNKVGERINPDKDIIIGQYVWIGLRATVLKGSVISDGSVIGAGALVSGVFSERNVIIAGNPAKIIRKQVFWKGQRKENFPVPNDLQELWEE